MTDPIVIPIDHSRRLLVEPWSNPQGHRLVTVAPQFQDRKGEWKLAHSGLILAPDVARELGPALVVVADDIDYHDEDANVTCVYGRGVARRWGGSACSGSV